ncbi:MAG: hypothetical protein NVS3B20_15470 [Polyangiales bacterium]
MKKTLGFVLCSLMLASSLQACAYGMIATTGDKVVIPRQDMFLFGILRKVFVCKVTDAGVTACATADSP